MSAYHALETYTLQAPAWREPLTIATSAYPELYPGATALYPPTSGSSTGTSTYAGQSRDAANVETGIVGVTKAKEDDLSETTVKTGLVTRPYVQSETFSAHQLIYPKFTHGHALPILSKLVSLVLEKRQSSLDITPQPGQWAYKPPSRVVYNDARREAWFNDLANPTVPLHKLSRNIPNNPASVTTAGTGTYGAAKGSASSTSGTAIDKHLEMLLTRQIQIERAVWFLRAIAGAEVAQALKSSRSFTSLPPAANYLTDFTSSVFEALRRQMNDIVLPLTHHAGLGLSSRPGMSVKGRARNTLAEEQGRARFIGRWRYMLALIDKLTQEALIERTVWASKISEWLATCHIAQLGWATDLVTDTCLNDIMHIGWMCKSLVSILVARLAELGPHPLQEARHDKTLLAETASSIKALLRRIWLTDQKAFIVPRLHAEHDSLRILREAALINGEDSIPWQDVTCRVESLRCEIDQSDQQAEDARYLDFEDGSLGCTRAAAPMSGSQKSLEQASGAPHFLSILDSYSIQDSLTELCSRYLAPSSLPFLDRRASHTSAPTPSSSAKAIPAMTIGLRLDLLLSWTVSLYRFGDHRKYIALYICKAYLDSPIVSELPAGPAALSQSTEQERQITLQQSVVTLLDNIGASGQYDLDAAVSLCCELVSHSVLDIASLVQIVVTRGNSTTVAASTTQSLYLRILQEASAHITSKSLRYQLGRLTSGTRMLDKHTLDEALAQEKVRLITELPLLLAQSHHSTLYVTPAIRPDGRLTPQAVFSMSQKCELYRAWLVPTAVSNIDAALDEEAGYEKQLAALIKTLQAVGHYDGILQLSYTILAHSSDNVVLDLITDVLQANMHVWHPKGVMQDIAEAAWQTHRRLVAQNRMSLYLAALIVDLGQAAALETSRIDDLAVDLAAMRSENFEEESDSFAILPNDPLSDGKSKNTSLKRNEEPGDKARQLLRSRAHDRDFPEDLVTDVLRRLIEGGVSHLEYFVELFLAVHAGLPAGLSSNLMSVLQPSGTQALVAVLQASSGSFAVIRFLQAVVLRGALDLSVLLYEAIEPALHSCLSLLEVKYSQGVQLAERLLDLLEPFWDWENIEDADSLRLEARFAGLMTADSADLILNCLSHLIAIMDAFHSENETLRKRYQTLCNELVGHAAFKTSILQDLDRVTSLLLETDQPRPAGMQTLSIIVSALKPRTVSDPMTHSESYPTDVEESSIASPTIYASQLARIELRLYLKELELQPKDSLTTQGVEFARQFVEKMLDENPTEGASIAVGQLSAFGPSGIQQLLQACLDIATRLLQNITSAVEQSSLTFSRLQRLLTIARHLIRQTRSDDAVTQLVVHPAFAATWTSAAQVAVAGDEWTQEHLKTLCDTCCLATRFSDIWTDNQGSLRATVGILLPLLKRDHEQIGCKGRRSLYLLDFISYCLDHTLPATRYQALFPFQHISEPAEHIECRFSATFKWLTTLSTPQTTILESTASTEDRLALYKPWDYAEHTETPATNAREAASANSGSIDLHRISARVISVLSRQEDLDDADAHRGRQSNFDSEISTLQESVWRTDFRRSLNAQLEVPPPTNTASTPAPAAEAASPNIPMAPVNTTAAKVTEQAKSAKSVAASKAGAEPTVTAPKKQTTKKRKIAPEVIVVEDDSPKRKKTASKKKK